MYENPKSIWTKKREIPQEREIDDRFRRGEASCFHWIHAHTSMYKHHRRDVSGTSGNIRDSSVYRDGSYPRQPREDPTPDGQENQAGAFTNAILQDDPIDGCEPMYRV